MTSALIIAIDTTLLIGALYFLIKASNILVHTLNEISRSQRIELFALVGFLSPLATALPELCVATSAALQENSALSLGVILGSNIVDITLVVGLAAILGGSLSVAGDFVHKDVFRALLAALLPFLFILDGGLSRFEGILLITGYWLYHFTVFKDKHSYVKKLENHPFKHIGSWLHRFDKVYKERQTEWFIFGTILTVVSAALVAALSHRLADDLHIPIVLIGLLIVAVGTSLPELVFEIKAAKQGKANMVFGNLLGSVVVNSTLTLGIVALLNPFTITGTERPVIGAVLTFCLSFGLLWLFIKTKLKLARWEGLILVALYLLYSLAEYAGFPF